MASDPVLYNQIVTFVANFMLRPMVDFANTHSDVGSTMTNLLVVPQLERPGGTQLGDPGTSIAGLAISPALLADVRPHHARRGADLAGRQPARRLHADDGAGEQRLARARAVDPVLDDLIAAHEFGHTGALVHSTAPRNLMFAGVTPGLDDCTDSLDDAQLTTLGATYGLGAAASAALVANRDRRAAARPFVPAAVVGVRARSPARAAGRRSAGDAVIRGAAVSSDGADDAGRRGALSLDAERAQAGVDPGGDQGRGLDGEQPGPDDAEGDAPAHARRVVDPADADDARR